ADEAVEVLEAPATGGPRRERTGRARLPYRNLVTLAELRGGIAIQLERLGQWRGGLGQNRGITRGPAGDLGDAAHPNRVVVAPRKQRLPGRGAESRGVKAVVLQAAAGQALRARSVTGAAECAGCTEPDIVEQNDEHVGCAFGRAQLLNGRIFGIRILRVVGDQAGPRPIGYR